MSLQGLFCQNKWVCVFCKTEHHRDISDDQLGTDEIATNLYESVVTDVTLSSRWGLWVLLFWSKRLTEGRCRYSAVSFLQFSVLKNHGKAERGCFFYLNYNISIRIKSDYHYTKKQLLTKLSNVCVRRNFEGEQGTDVFWNFLRKEGSMYIS